MKVIDVTRALRAGLGPRIQELESSAVYPLGDDTFRIDHGPDYFAFFDRMGAVRYFAALAGDDVVAVAACVLRSVPGSRGGSRRAWYLCDLKVRPDHRGRGLSIELMAHGFRRCYLRCARGYAISMNPGSGAPNPVVRLLRRFRAAPLAVACELHIHSLSAGELCERREAIERDRGAFVLLSLRGTKDLILGSTGRPLDLWHVQFASAPAGSVPLAAVPAAATCMVCVPAGDPLARALSETGSPPSATATVLAHRLPDVDWRFLATSDI